MSNENDQFFSINTTTGEWVSTDPLTHEQGCVIAASVMPGWTPEKVDALYNPKPVRFNFLGYTIVLMIFAVLVMSIVKLGLVWFT